MQQSSLRGLCALQFACVFGFFHLASCCVHIRIASPDYESCRVMRLNSPLVIEYTLTERALPGSLRVQLRAARDCDWELCCLVLVPSSGFDIIWLRSLAPVPGMPSPKALGARRRREARLSARQADPQSPHSFVVYPAKDRASGTDFRGVSTSSLLALVGGSRSHLHGRSSRASTGYRPTS